MNTCPDCSVAPGKKHKRGCDVARCAYSGTQLIQCFKDIHVQGFTDTKCTSQRWTGEWPGVRECQKYGLYVWSSSVTHLYKPVWEPGLDTVTEDLNELHCMNCQWDVQLEEFVPHEWYLKSRFEQLTKPRRSRVV